MSRLSHAVHSASSSVHSAVSSVRQKPFSALSRVTNPWTNWASEATGIDPGKLVMMQAAAAGGAGLMFGGGPAATLSAGTGGGSTVGGIGGLLGFGRSMLPSLLGAGASIYGANEAADAQRSANETNIELAREQMAFSAAQADREMDFQRNMSNTSYQRGIEDMRKAGINPIMAAGNGGASTPSGAMGSGTAAHVDAVPSVVSNALSSATDVFRTVADVRKSFADADAARASADLSRARIPQTGAETEKTKADTEASKFEQRTFKLLNGVFDRVKGSFDHSAKGSKFLPFLYKGESGDFDFGK